MKARIACGTFAHGPVAAKEKPILAEHVPQGIEDRPIEGQVGWGITFVSPRSLDQGGPLATPLSPSRRCPHSPQPGSRHRLAIDQQVASMIDYHAKPRK